MMNNTPDVQNTKYSTILARMIRLTDKVSTAAMNMNTDDLGRLLAERKILCDSLVSFRRTLSALDEDSERMESVLLAKQANCESVVAASLAETRKSLGELHRKKGLGSAYTPKPDSNQAVFLDNRT